MTTSLTLLNWDEASEPERRRALRRPVSSRSPELRRRVREILREVKRDRDAALFRLTEAIDRVKLEALEVPRETKTRALEGLPLDVRAALERAATQIEAFHRASLPRKVSLEVSPGLVCRREPRALDRVGLYVPGGTAPLPSTVLMLGVPAKLAGCGERVLCTPPRRDGTVNEAILAASLLCGIDRVFAIGGAQAVGAMAYGTESVPRVDKIFGPGNAWVTEAKQRVSIDPRGAAIDMPAGPSEVMVVADASARADFVAADLLSQAEHGPDSQVLLVTTSERLAADVAKEVALQLERLPRKDVALRALASSRALVVRNLETAIAVANRYAPEHLILQIEAAEAWTERVRNAGSVFVGAWSPEAAGDYASGTNHVLPTYGYARAYSGVSVDSFVKQVTFQSLSPEAAREIAGTVERLAALEGLEAHRFAMAIRREAVERGETR